MKDYYMRVLCFGGRKYADAAFVDQALTTVGEKFGRFVLIHGGASGADFLCAEWGKRHGLPIIGMDANWDFYGDRAGPLRNTWMADFALPNYGVKFPGGSGTTDMRNKLLSRGIPVWNPADTAVMPSTGVTKV